MLYLMHLVSFSMVLYWSLLISSENSIHDYVENKCYLSPLFGYILGVVLVYGFKSLFLM
jgi:hypothetical protein